MRTDDAEEYGRYIQDTGFGEYAETRGNRGAWMLRREPGHRTEFLTFTLWESLDAVKAFAGEDYEKAVLYPEDERFLVEREDRTAHYEVDAQA